MTTQQRLTIPLPLVFAVGLLVILGALALSPGVVNNLVGVDEFQPHAYCFLWKPDLLLLYVTSDSFIAFSYLTISVLLVYLVYRAGRSLPFPSMFLAFGAFIITCGLTHFMDIWTLWTPVYWLAGSAKFVTAIASTITAVAMPRFIPRALKLVETAKLSEQRKNQLIAVNHELEAEVERRKQIESELLRALEKEKDLNELRANFITTISHEFRTPMTVIYTSTQLLQNYADRLTASRKADCLNNIEREINKMISMLDATVTIREFDRGSITFQPTHAELVKFCTDCVAAFQLNHPQRQITFTSTNSRIETVFDTHLLKQAITQLLSNAVRYSPDEAEIHIELSTNEQHITLKVTDFGMGIPADEQKNLFAAFFRAHNVNTIPGVGLGLTIVRHALDLHGGSIEVSSIEGSGSVFTLTLPRYSSNHATG